MSTQSLVALLMLAGLFAMVGWLLGRRRSIGDPHSGQIHPIEIAAVQRNRTLARAMHNGVGQRLAAAKFRLAVVRQEVCESAPASTQELDAVMKLLDESCQDIRDATRDMVAYDPPQPPPTSPA